MRELKAKIHASELAMRTKDIDVDRSLEIKPDLFLPDAVGFYALDRNKLIRQMKQSQAILKMSTGREVERIMTGIPLIPSKETMEISGEHAAMRLATPEPEFYMRPADSREPRFRLLRAQIKGGQRVIDDIGSTSRASKPTKPPKSRFRPGLPPPASSATPSISASNPENTPSSK